MAPPHVAYVVNGERISVPIRLENPESVSIGTRLWIGALAPDPEAPRSAQEADLRSRADPIAYPLLTPGVPRYWILLSPTGDGGFETRFHGAPGEIAVVVDRAGSETKLWWGHGCRDDGRAVPSFFRDAPVAQVDGYAEILVGEVRLVVSDGLDVATPLAAAIRADDFGTMRANSDAEGADPPSPAWPPAPTFASVAAATRLKIPQLRQLIVDFALDQALAGEAAGVDAASRYDLHLLVAENFRSSYEPGQTFEAWERRRRRTLSELETASAGLSTPYASNASPPAPWLIDAGVDLASLDPTLYEIALSVVRNSHAEAADASPDTAPADSPLPTPKPAGGDAARSNGTEHASRASFRPEPSDRRAEVRALLAEASRRVAKTKPTQPGSGPK